MPINSNYNEEAIVEAIATALDNFYTNLISNIDKLNIKKVMKRKNPYLFRAKAMNGAAQIIDAILAAFVSSSEETIFGNVFFEPIATAAAQGQKAFPDPVHSNINRLIILRKIMGFLFYVTINLKLFQRNTQQ